MIYYVALVTLIFFSRFHFGIQRLNKRPKTIMYYNHNSDMVDMILNCLIAVIGLCLLIGTNLKMH